MRISDWSSDVCSSDLPSGNTDRTDGIPGQMVVDDLRYAALTEGGLPYLAGDIAPGTNSYIRDAAGRPLPLGAGGDLVPLTLRRSLARSEERRVGQEGARTCRAWWSPFQ